MKNFLVNILNLKVIDNKTIYVYEKIDESGAINNELLKAGIEVDSIYINHESLEEYFINLTGGEKYA